MGLKDIRDKVLAFYQKRFEKMAGISEPLPYPGLKTMITELAAYPEEAFCRYGFHREVLRDRLSASDKAELIKRCQEEGGRFAQELIDRCGTSVPSEIAKKLGITIKRPEMPVGGGRVLFAEFEEPAEIRIYQSAIKNADQAIEAYDLKDVFKDYRIEEILIAHELFHRVESEHKKDIFTLNYRIPLWGIGKLQYTSHIAALSEITAMCFAKRLYGMDFSPYLLDVFLSYTYNKDVGGALYNEIKREKR